MFCDIWLCNHFASALHQPKRRWCNAETTPCSTQQTRYIDPMLIYSWAVLGDGGPTLTQHCVNVFCFLGAAVCRCAHNKANRGKVSRYGIPVTIRNKRRIHKMSISRASKYGIPIQSLVERCPRYLSIKTDLMLANHLLRWTNINSTLERRLVLNTSRF